MRERKKQIRTCLKLAQKYKGQCQVKMQIPICSGDLARFIWTSGSQAILAQGPDVSLYNELLVASGLKPSILTKRILCVFTLCSGSMFQEAEQRRIAGQTWPADRSSGTTDTEDKKKKKRAPTIALKKKICMTGSSSHVIESTVKVTYGANSALAWTAQAWRQK